MLYLFPLHERLKNQLSKQRITFQSTYYIFFAYSGKIEGSLMEKYLIYGFLIIQYLTPDCHAHAAFPGF